MQRIHQGLCAEREAGIMMNAVQARCNQLLLVSLLTVMFLMSVDEKASPILQQQHFFKRDFLLLGKKLSICIWQTRCRLLGTFCILLSVVRVAT